MTVALRCAGCGLYVAAGQNGPYRCPAARPGDDIDHLLEPQLPAAAFELSLLDGNRQPFRRFATHLSSYFRAREGGLSDEDFAALAMELDRAVAAIDGRGFVETPLLPSPELAAALGLGPAGQVWLKDETGNVGGSHKGRHLMGLLLHLAVSERLSPSAAGPKRALAIASCGNAALAAAVLARAVSRPLLVYIPPSAEPSIVARLRALGAELTLCERAPSERGDPCYRRFAEAVDCGALPFCCQGPDNGLTIEGGKTLAYELFLRLASQGQRLHSLVVQVGGGALASSCVQAVEELLTAGIIAQRPRLFAVQSTGAAPLCRAYQRLLAWIAAQLGAGETPPALPAHFPTWAERLRTADMAPIVEAALAHARTHRQQFMSPWESEPRSIAHGILDDETYDWLAPVAGLLRSGGYPLVVDEPTLVEAHGLVRSATGLAVDHTGTAGFAGLLALKRSGGLRPGDSVAALLTGADAKKSPLSGAGARAARAPSGQGGQQPHRRRPGAVSPSNKS